MLTAALSGVVSLVTAAEPAPVYRVRQPEGADVVSREGREGPLYSAGDVATDTKLPVGYPRPTPPGAIEIKHYPSIRQAEVSGDGSVRGASWRGFRPLFNHISRNDIAMTAPVEMVMDEGAVETGEGAWTMAFLYHTTENGPTGEDGTVRIVDTKPVTVVSIGVQGARGFERLGAAVQELEAWIDASDDWERAGEVRSLGYNGPYTPVNRRWWEVQIPVRSVDENGAAGADAVGEAQDVDEGETL